MKTALFLIILLLSCQFSMSYDVKTTEYIEGLTTDIIAMDTATSPTDWRGQQAIVSMRGTLEAITIDMSRCPFMKWGGKDKGLCKTWWIIKMKPLYKGVIY